MGGGAGSNALDALRLYLVQTGYGVLYLAPRDDGTLVPLGSGTTILRADYVSEGESFESVSLDTRDDHLTLLMILPSLDGPPSRRAVAFVRHQALSGLSYLDSSHSPRHGFAGLEYLVALSNTSYTWSSNIRAGRPGYFMTGGMGTHNLWRITYVEADAAKRSVFTLYPVKLSHGLPVPDFTCVGDSGLRGEAEQHWADLAGHLAHHSYYALVTSAKNLAEAILADYFVSRGDRGDRDFSTMLVKLRKLLDAKEPGVPYKPLDYHLMQKLRILHAETHPPRAVASGGLRPELALTVVEDLARLLTTVGAVCP